MTKARLHTSYYRLLWIASLEGVHQGGERGEGPEAPSSRSEIRRIRIRSRTITTASWSDCFSQWQWQRQKQRGRWGRGHEWGHGGGCRWWCRMIQDDVRLFTQIFPKCTGQFPHLLYQACIDPTSHYSIPFYTLLPFQVTMTYFYLAFGAYNNIYLYRFLRYEKKVIKKSLALYKQDSWG